MKKISLLFLLTFLSCFEKDIELPLSNDEDLIVGDWNGSFISYISADGSDIFWDEFYCQDEVIIHCYEDGRLWYVDFIQNPESEDACVEDILTKQGGTWKRIENGVYEFYLQNGFTNSEIVISPRRIEFGQRDQPTKTMKIFYNEPPEIGPKDAVSYIRTFSRYVDIIHD